MQKKEKNLKMKVMNIEWVKFVIFRIERRAYSS